MNYSAGYRISGKKLAGYSANSASGATLPLNVLRSDQLKLYSLKNRSLALTMTLMSNDLCPIVQLLFRKEKKIRAQNQVWSQLLDEDYFDESLLALIDFFNDRNKVSVESTKPNKVSRR